MVKSEVPHLRVDVLYEMIISGGNLLFNFLPRLLRHLLVVVLEPRFLLIPMKVVGSKWDIQHMLVLNKTALYFEPY
jgi:hypothetical protein